jgi:hypothetical protein
MWKEKYNLRKCFCVHLLQTSTNYHEASSWHHALEAIRTCYILVSYMLKQQHGE